jgi:hypothetical protein
VQGPVKIEIGFFCFLNYLWIAHQVQTGCLLAHPEKMVNPCLFRFRPPSGVSKSGVGFSPASNRAISNSESAVFLNMNIHFAQIPFAHDGKGLGEMKMYGQMPPATTCFPQL